jgi:hypothetical protein
VATFAGRVRLNDGEACAFAILESMRSGDPSTVRHTVGQAGGGLDAWLRSMVFAVLAQWRGTAPAAAVNVAVAAVEEAQRLRWDQQPRRSRRLVEPLSQDPGMRVVA